MYSHLKNSTLDPLIYTRLHDTIREIYSNAAYNNDAYRIIDLLDSVSQQQLISKLWVKEILTLYSADLGRVAYLCGWYGLGSYLLKDHASQIDSIDMDPGSKDLGRKLFDGIKFVTENIFSRNLRVYDTIVCTSCEHLPIGAVNKIISQCDNKLVCLQSTDFKHPTHVNTHATVDDFISSIDRMHMSVVWKGSIELGDCNRHMVILK